MQGPAFEEDAFNATGGCALIVVFSLAGHQMGVHPAPLHQLLMATGFHDFPLVHHHDLVRVANGAEAMGNDQSRSPFLQLVEGRLHNTIALRVQGAGGFVQH
jgi:hypothetical protein